MSIVRNLMVRAGADFSRLTQAMQAAQRRMQNFRKSMQEQMDGVSAALGGLAVGFVFAQAVQDAVKVEGALISLNVLLGDSADAFTKWASESAAALGMSKTEAIDYGKTYANLLSGFATSNEDTLTMTQDLLKASAVIASMSGRQMTDVMERIRSGMLGNTEAIEDLGINVNIAMIESTNAFKQFANGKSWAQLDFKIQQQIRYFAILEQTSTKFGTELADTTGLKLAQFSAHLGNLRLALGNAFLPILNAILPAMTRFVQAMATGMEAVATFSRALFGMKKAQPKKSEAKAVGAVGGAYEDTADAVGKAAKEQKGFLAGFDEINAVPDAQAAAGAGAAVDAAGMAGGSMPAPNTKNVTEKLEEVASKAEQMGLRVRQSFVNMSKHIKENGDLIIATLTGIGIAFTILKAKAAFSAIMTAIGALGGAMAILLNPITWIVLGIAALVAAVVYFYRTNEKFRGIVDGIFKKIGEIAVWLWNDVLKPLGAWLADVFVIAWQKVSDAAVWLYKNVLTPLGNYLMTLYTEVIEPLSVLLGEVLAMAFQNVADVAKAFWENTLKPVAKNLETKLQPAIENVSLILQSLWNDGIVPVATFLGDVFLAVLKDVTARLTSLWDKMKPGIAIMKEVFLVVLDNVSKAVGGFINGIIDVFGGLLEFFAGVFTGDWEKVWNGLKDIFSGVFDSLAAIAKTPLNIIIDLVNKLIGGLNTIGIDLPGWLGGGSFKFNVPTIPKLARGGIVTSPTLAMIGEQGPEMVVPLENTSFVDALASAVGTAVMGAMQFSGGTSNNQQQDVVVQIDGNTLARVLNPYLTKETQRTGNALVRTV